jgi:asparagine synthase (glutamine-hydrolysing)
MCGLAGIARSSPGPIGVGGLRQMAAALRHRGPDAIGSAADDRIGLAHARLSVLDAAGGAQPMDTEDGRFSIAYNGEIFNFLELRDELTAKGHRFVTRTDTEVVLRGWAEWGDALLPRLNGQFAFAIADRVEGSVVLARDRFGILPLFHAVRGGTLYFASEVKALFASGEVDPAIDPRGLDQVFTFWGARAPRTPFAEVYALEPGCWGRWCDGRLAIRRWYELDFPQAADEPDGAEATLGFLLRSAVDHRLIADVTVGAYLSGGLDSSLVCALAGRSSPDPLHTFSVTFDDPRFDESAGQREVAAHAGTVHATQRITDADIGRVFPEVVWHAETPLLRTAPAPLFLLSRLVRERGTKVVLSGEGADEVFGGYDLFKDTAVRLFCLRQPGSALRPRLFDRLYRQDAPERRGADFWRQYFLAAGPPDDPLFSHLPRFRQAEWLRGFYAPEFAARLAADRVDPLEELRAELPAAFARWTPMARAAYLEMVTLLSPYLLAAQGDRMAMAHGVELRVPYLDHRVAEFAAALPDTSKLRALRDKRLLRRFAARALPATVARRPKQPYRAPSVAPFLGAAAPAWVAEALEPESVRRTGIFDPRAVAPLVARCRAGAAPSTREGQALVAILSSQLWSHAFIDGTGRPHSHRGPVPLTSQRRR